MTRNPVVDSRAGAAAIAFLLGCAGMVFVFADAVEGWPLRVAAGSAFFLLSGAAVGFIYPTVWPISMLASWGGVLMGGLTTLVALARQESGAPPIAGPGELKIGLTMLFGSLALSLIGGLVGKLISKILFPTRHSNGRP